MIPKEIQENHLFDAILDLEKNSYPKERVSTQFDLYYNGKRLPPKMVISRAYQLITGKELTPSTFEGGEKTNSFLIKKGFPVIPKNNIAPSDFFTKEEIKFFQQCVENRTYDSKNPIHNNAGKFINEFLWNRSKYWAEAICEEIDDLNIKGTKSWLQLDSASGQRFKDYTWYRLLQANLDFELVFFTVGIDGNTGALIYKLDCQNESGKKALSPFQVDVFRAMLKDRNIELKYVALNEIEWYTWERLIAESKNFIRENLDNYRDIVQTVSQARKGKYARMCWNDNGWIAPSGASGKSNTSADSQEKENNFGYEEWLLDLDKTIEGYHYSRIQAVKTPKNKYAGETLNLCLYTHNSITKEWYWCGWINQVEVIEPEDSEKITRIYRDRGWRKEQQKQLAFVDANVENFDQWPTEDLFNIRFKPEDVEIFDPVPFGPDQRPPSRHYNLVEVTPDNLVSYRPIDQIGPDVLPEKGGSIHDQKIVKNFTGGVREYENIHGQVQTFLYKYLQEKHPNDLVVAEKRMDNNRRIDIRRKGNDGLIFYEVKSYPTAIYSLRAALGQLFEYMLYPGGQLAKKIYVATHKDLSPNDRVYLKKLNEHLSDVEIGYVYVNLDKEEVAFYE